jgi:hypothetical protein
VPPGGGPDDEDGMNGRRCVSYEDDDDDGPANWETVVEDVGPAGLLFDCVEGTVPIFSP